MFLTLYVPSTLCQVSMRPPQWVTGCSPPPHRLELNWVSACYSLPAQAELLPPAPPFSCCPTVEQVRRHTYTGQRWDTSRDIATASIMTTWTLLFVIVGSYLSQSAEGFTVKISEHLPTVDCKQTLANLEVSSVLTSLPLPSVSSSLSCRYFCCWVFPVIQFCMFADVLTCWSRPGKYICWNNPRPSPRYTKKPETFSDYISIFPSSTFLCLLNKIARFCLKYHNESEANKERMHSKLFRKIFTKKGLIVTISWPHHTDTQHSDQENGMFCHEMHPLFGLLHCKIFLSFPNLFYFLLNSFEDRRYNYKIIAVSTLSVQVWVGFRQLRAEFIQILLAPWKALNILSSQ